MLVEAGHVFVDEVVSVMQTPSRGATVDGFDEEGNLCCYDCGLLYSSPAWCDVVIDDDVWERIAPRPGGGGVLCLTCMAARIIQAGITEDVEAVITSGPFSSIGGLSRCMQCGHRQVEPNWCKKCGNRVEVPEWAEPYVEAFHAAEARDSKE
jgi:hypothetical protein